MKLLHELMRNYSHFSRHKTNWTNEHNYKQEWVTLKMHSNAVNNYLLKT